MLWFLRLIIFDFSSNHWNQPRAWAAKINHEVSIEKEAHDAKCAEEYLEENVQALDKQCRDELGHGLCTISDDESDSVEDMAQEAASSSSCRVLEKKSGE